jgi:threonine dehydrogenase-like Zn-dependent dehydrogenase
VVSGLGPVGLLATLFGSRTMGAEIVGIDPSAERRALAEKLGARRTFDPSIGPIGEQVRANYPEGADKLLDASGATLAHQAIPSDEIWQFCRRHAIAPSQVVTHRFGIERGAEAFRLADTATTGKVCFSFD